MAGNQYWNSSILKTILEIKLWSKDYGGENMWRGCQWADSSTMVPTIQ